MDKTRSEHGRGEGANSWFHWMVRLLRGAILAGLVTLLGLLAGACLISYGLLNQGQMSGIVLASCVLGGLCGGIFAIGRQGVRSLPMGLGVALIQFSLCVSGGVIAYGNEGFSSRGVGIFCACLCGGTMAGILCRKHQKKSR